MSQSLRQKPPKDRSAAYAALIVAGLILAGCVGWMANSMFNGNRDDAKENSIHLARNQAKGGKTRDNPTDKNADIVTDDTDQKKGVAFKKNNDSASHDRERTKMSKTKPAFVDPNEGNSTKKSSSGSLDPNQLEKELIKGPPKLSELDSFKKNPNKTRVKSSNSHRQKKKTPGSKSTVQTPKKNRSTESFSSDQSANTDSKTKPNREEGGERNQFAFEQSTSNLVFYQELVVDRNPIFGIEGISALNQKFKYRTVSRITVHPGKNGFRKVTQKVVGAHLISADSISKKSIEESVKKLIGKEFQITLDKKQKVVDFKGEKEPPKSIDFKDLTSIDGFKGDGFMVSSVMDLDGWREMAQLTFLLPDDKKKKWSDQMEHDWGELGRWVGETRFDKKGETNGKLRIDYAHFMRYETAPKGKSKLPFTLGEIEMESKEAGGRLFFDREKKRIDTLIERFQVSGSIGASLLGGSTKLKIQETQTFELKLHDQSPQ